jgi:hypothetical protein
MTWVRLSKNKARLILKYSAKPFTVRKKTAKAVLKWKKFENDCARENHECGKMILKFDLGQITNRKERFTQ